MTEAIGIPLSAIHPAHEHGRRHRDTSPEGAAFGEVLQEGTRQASLTESVPSPHMDEHRGWQLAKHLSRSPFEPHKDGPAESDEAPRDERDASEAPFLREAVPVFVENAGIPAPSLIEGRTGVRPSQEGSAPEVFLPAFSQPKIRTGSEPMEEDAGRAFAPEKGDLRANGAVARGLQGEAPAIMNARLTADQKTDTPAAPRNERTPRFSAKGNEDTNEQASYGGNSGIDQKQTPVRVINAQTTPTPAAILPGISSTAGVLASSLAGDPRFASTAAAAVRAISESRPHSPEPVSTLRLQLQPAHLGIVTARLSVSEKQLVVELEVETPEARRTLQADGDAMREALRALGYDIDRITVLQAPNSASFTSAGSTSARDPGFQAGAGQGQQGGGSQPQARQGNDHGGAASREAVDRRQNDAAGDGLYI